VIHAFLRVILTSSPPKQLRTGRLLNTGVYQQCRFSTYRCGNGMSRKRVVSTSFQGPNYLMPGPLELFSQTDAVNKMCFMCFCLLHAKERT